MLVLRNAPFSVLNKKTIYGHFRKSVKHLIIFWTTYCTESLSRPNIITRNTFSTDWKTNNYMRVWMGYND